jgi:hypothetical protein
LKHITIVGDSKNIIHYFVMGTNPKSTMLQRIIYRTKTLISSTQDNFFHILTETIGKSTKWLTRQSEWPLDLESPRVSLIHNPSLMKSPQSQIRATWAHDNQRTIGGSLMQIGKGYKHGHGTTILLLSPGSWEFASYA